MSRELKPGSTSCSSSYDFMTRLRHHGFPSPLLDWPQSPYTAAFFAFNKKEIVTMLCDLKKIDFYKKLCVHSGLR
jgi:hypothetical protein